MTLSINLDVYSKGRPSGFWAKVAAFFRLTRAVTWKETKIDTVAQSVSLDATDVKIPAGPFTVTLSGTKGTVAVDYNGITIRSLTIPAGEVPINVSADGFRVVGKVGLL